MKKISSVLLLILFSAIYVSGQNNASGPVVQYPAYFDVSPPLRDIKEKKTNSGEVWKDEDEHEVPNKFRAVSSLFTPDGAIQETYNNGSKSMASAPLVNFNGMTNASNTGGRVTPPDPAGDVGPNHYVQVVNDMLQVFNKSGVSLYGPVLTSTLWNGFTGNWTGHNNGDAIVLYDETADRWIISQFAIDCPGTPYTEYEMVAVSMTGDPTGSYYRYAFQFDYMPDYPKLGVWQDGYYMAVNRFNTNLGNTPFIGVGACVMERSKMLTGDPTARMIYFKTETLGGSGSGAGANCWSMLPSDCDGTLPAAGTPNYFTYIDGTPELRLWALHTDWTTTANATFTFLTALPVAAYTGMGSGSVTQPGALQLDALGDRLMFRNQYRNFGSYETFVTCHTVNTGGNVAGIRWYEYRKTGSAFSLYQQSTYAPGDGNSRWMGSIAMNAIGDIGMAYSVASGTMYPSIWFTGRKAIDPLNQMTMAEGLIQTGTTSMTDYSRWGDYSAVNVDPSDNTTFWTTQEYVGTFSGWAPWATKISSFKALSLPDAVTLAATLITPTGGTLNGTLNPHGLATSCYFQWGTTTGYGNTTATISGGSGTTTFNVSAILSGLAAGTAYHYRLVAVNSDGTNNGNDMTIIPGSPSLTTSAVAAIALSTATSGGIITADGGSAVIARGICWGTSVNPSITGSHTTDGSGTGTFGSALSGLTSNTLYHVRAYATNVNGTFYGNDVTFHTLCAIFTFPFNEGFTGTTIPGCWSHVDNFGGGQVWQFGTITGESPLPNLTGNYAYLNSDAYGTGFSQNADLVTPALDFTGYSAVNLAFSHYFRAISGSSGSVSYSINNGSTWNTITTFTATSVNNPDSYSQAVNAVAGQPQVKFKWNYTGSYGWYWGIDNISITGTCTAIPVSNSISALSNPVCAGTNATFTATPVNGGLIPAYQWKVNGVNAGTNSNTYSYTPANNDVVTCLLTSNANCATGNPATSNPVTMTVNPVVPVSISISPSANPVGQANPVTFTAFPVNSGPSPGYQWMVNGANAGTSSITYAYTPVNGDVVKCVLNSSMSCKSGNPATSNLVTMTVVPLAPTVNLSNVTVSGTQCFNASQTITVAGSGSTFTVPAAASATLIAGQNILFNPGSVVKLAGYLHGYIAPGGPYCLTPSLPSVAMGNDEVNMAAGLSFFRVYPNPTSGIFTLELDRDISSEKLSVEIYDMKGEKILSLALPGERKHEFSLSGQPKGLYFLRVSADGLHGSSRIVRQ